MVDWRFQRKFDWTDLLTAVLAEGLLRLHGAVVERPESVFSLVGRYGHFHPIRVNDTGPT